MKVAIIYWSGTGNTLAMANAIVEGVKQAGAEAELFDAGEFNSEKTKEFDAFAFGCPAMGAEELEDSEFLPMWEEVSGMLSGKRVVLFGSYGWGDGEWMRIWQDDAPCAIAETYICQELPGEEEEAKCRALGTRLAS